MNSTKIEDEGLTEIIDRVSQEWAMIMGDFNLPDINWNTITAKSKNSSQFVKCIQDNL